MREPNLVQCCLDSNFVDCIVAEVKDVAVVFPGIATNLILESPGEGDKETRHRG
jgi:hypothetical protein